MTLFTLYNGLRQYYLDTLLLYAFANETNTTLEMPFLQQ
ncbi:hypothetical protein JCM19275_35 [Nonlabens ulvanivorans]|uniref:Uncharacterized protein n=1 Tax=Nonlabens ulvanivorans TaxID=906888 RepID=A0A090WIZ9_NONUL|nr:hypothetical protein JCM19275_35 [Nonlabens ulvanivorans]